MRTIAILLVVATLVPSATLAAPKQPDAPALLPERDRIVAGGRAVQVAVAQSEIGTSVDVGRVAASTGGGLIGALIISGMDDKHKRLKASAAERAETAVAPLRDALRGYDIDALALTATRLALAKPDWFQPREITLTRDISSKARRAFASAAPTSQAAFFSYHYSLSPDFTRIQVSADIRLEYKTFSKGKTAASPLFYHQTVTSIVQLGKRSYNHPENIAQWTADDGKLAKTALAAGFGELERLIPYALGLGTTDIKALTAKDREKGFGAGFYGPLVARDTNNPNNLTLWSRDGLVHIRTLPTG